MKAGGAIPIAGEALWRARARCPFQPSTLPDWHMCSTATLPSTTTEVELHAGRTSPPDYLTEAELIDRMERHGIGTDASIPVHINNICERGYVSIQAGRRVVPTELGVTLVRGYQLIDPELCRPQVRAHVEKQIDLVAKVRRGGAAGARP
jgi:DNA topoisomerase IA